MVEGCQPYLDRSRVVESPIGAEVHMQPLRKRPSDYLRENFYITNSGVAWEPAIKFTQAIVGVDRVLYAMDYPYQYAPEEVVVLDGMTMSTEDKKKFFQSNAEALFKIPAPPVQ